MSDTCLEGTDGLKVCLVHTLYALHVHVLVLWCMHECLFDLYLHACVCEHCMYVYTYKFKLKFLLYIHTSSSSSFYDHVTDEQNTCIYINVLCMVFQAYIRRKVEPNMFCTVCMCMHFLGICLVVCAADVHMRMYVIMFVFIHH